MTRLTKELRKQIAKNAVTTAFATRKEALNTRQNTFADKVYEVGFGKLKPVLQRLEADHKTMSDVLLTHVDNPTTTRHQIRVNFAGCTADLQMTEARLLPNTYSYRAAIAFDAEHELTREWEALAAEEKALRAAENSLESQVTGVVESVTTVKRLLEVWPEAKDLLPEQTAKATTAVALPIGTLNHLIGLPKPEVA